MSEFPPGYLDNTPVRLPPEGQESNFVDPVSRAYQLEVVIAIALALVVLFSSSRIYCRLKVTNTFGADDWLCIVATIVFVTYSALVLKILHEPGGGVIGIHLWDVSLAKYSEFLRQSLADAVLIRLCSTIIKVGFYVFYLRLFYPYQHVRIMIWTGMGAVVTFCIVFVITDLIACSPWPKERLGWMDPSLTERCNSIAPDLVTAGAYFNVISDFYTLFIPLHLLPNLNFSRKRKVGLSLIFLTGLLACGAALTNLIIRSDKGILDMADFTWTLVPVYATSLVEVSVGLVCLSMPVVFTFLIGRVTDWGHSLRSWVKERRARRYGPGDTPSSESLALDCVTTQTPPRLSGSTPTATLTGIRKFIRNIYRSEAGHSANDSTRLPSYNDLASTDLSYHDQLRKIQTGPQASRSNFGSETVHSKVSHRAEQV